MKALILAGGRGRRLGQFSDNSNKCFLKVGGRPIIEYSLECAVQADVSEIVIVVGYRAEDIINQYGNRYRDKVVRYVIQQEQRGVVHAIEMSREAVGGSDFMLLLGDEVMVNPLHSEMVRRFTYEDLFGICGIVTVNNKELIGKTYSLIQGTDDKIYRLVEKPKNPFNNLMGTGNCIFKNEIYNYIDETPINQKRGEKELPDLIQSAIDDGRTIKSFRICNGYLNVNSETELKEAASSFAHI